MDAIEFKPSQLSLTLVRIHDSNVDKVQQTLEQKLAKAGKFLRGAAVVVEPIADLMPTALAQIIELLRQFEMTPVGIRSNDVALIDYAEMSGLAAFKPSNQNNTAPEAEPAKVATEAAPTTQIESSIVEASSAPQLHTAVTIANSMRSGQMEQHLFNDVIVRGTVNSGAEIFAGGHLSIYGAVRGRVHAGATGNPKCRIIAYNFNPELVSIAGVFLLSDDIPTLAKQGWVEVYLENQSLKFSSLG